VALDALSLEVRPGELLCVLGRSGSGKSTALRVIAGLEQPDAGRVEIGGRDVTTAEPRERGVAMVFQTFALFPHLSVAENVGFGLRARGEERAGARERVRAAAEALELGSLLDRRPAQLSGGERQRVALARALVARPQVLLLDEPLSNLDAVLRTQTRAEIRRVHDATGATSVYVTHDQAEALALGERVAVLDRGRVAQVGPPEEVYAHPATAAVAAFVGTPPMNLLDAVVEDGELRAGPVRLPLPPGAGVAAGERVTAGVRAEHLLLTDGDAAHVELVERAGHEHLVHLRAGGRRLLARGEPGAQRVGVTATPDHVRLFDAATGKAL
jgi:multiple sugar transport system ATP-binding protein